MPNGYAITAMMAMLDSLVSELRSRVLPFSTQSAEQLAWLLGDPSSLFPEDDDEAGWFLRREPKTPVQRVIAEAARCKRDEPISEEFMHLVVARRCVLRQQRLVCEIPYDVDEARISKTVALLPDEATLSRLTRYETHAQRSLIRNLETLAKLRGAGVETLRASLVHVAADGSALAMQGSRQRWAPGETLRQQ